MDTRVTIIKQYRNRETLRLMETENLVETIRSCQYQEGVDAMRHYYPIMKDHRSEDGTLTQFTTQTKQLPRICIALQMETVNQSRLVKGYSGLVLLEVNNLPGIEEAEAVRRGAAEMPQTLMAFVGAEGQSVKIVCRGELFPNEGGGLPRDEKSTRDFHQNLYERARLIYNGQLGVTVEKLDPKPERICYMAADPKVVYNPLATPIYARAEPVTSTNLHALSDPYEYEMNTESIVSVRTAYEFNLSKAMDDAEGIADKDEQRHVVLTRLAEYCQQTGIPMALARQMAKSRSWLNSDPQLVAKVFENAYRQEQSKRYKARKHLPLTGQIPAETLLTMKVNLFLNANYDLRKNVMRGVAEYRERRGLGFSYQDLTEEARNSITMRAHEHGIKCWDKDIRRYVNSNDIRLYDPINEYLERLTFWDGQDRVTPLAMRIPTDWAEWPHLFHIWMRSMVAMWLGKGQLTGNALVPLLIGRQGCGKTSFCRLLLPPELMNYYNDRINFKNESDLNLGLTSFALINLDEFDKITQRQQIVLKYLVSTTDLNYRPPYGKAYQSHRRYASFIGTTNEQMPLTDPTGARRFICVNIDGDIDFQTPVYHDMLYAQLRHEIDKGERYWLTKEEEQQLMQHNLQYQQLNGLGEMLLSVIQRPRKDEDGQWMSLKEISALLKSHFKNYQEDASAFQKIGNFLKRPEYRFESRRTSSGMTYWVKLKE